MSVGHCFGSSIIHRVHRYFCRPWLRYCCGSAEQTMIVGFSLQALAELLTTNKLSELACLTLYLMYEKKNGKQSVWYEFIKASDASTCRGHIMARDMHEIPNTCMKYPITAPIA